MKILFTLQSLFLLQCFGISVTAQKYTTARDTLKLNMEYIKVSNEIDALKVDLTSEQNKLSEYRDRAKGLKPVAENTASLNNQPDGKATGVSLVRANETNDKANKSNNEMEAQKEAEKQQIKVDKISRQIEKKQQRLQQLIDMRYKIDFMTRPYS